MSTATLNGTPVTELRVVLGSSGQWHAEGTTDRAVALEGVATLVVAGLTLVGRSYRGGPYLGEGKFRLRAGADDGSTGWSKVVPGRSWQKRPKLSTVLADIARECGETIEVTAAQDREIGPFLVRLRCPAARVLNWLVDSWRIDADGVTRIGERTGSLAASRYDIQDHDPASGMTTIAPDAPGDFLPGDSFILTAAKTTVTIGRTVIRLDGDGLRVFVWPQEGAHDRVVGDFQHAIRETFPALAFACGYRYRVQSVDGDTLSLRPVRGDLDLPQLPKVPHRSGVPGVTHEVTVGSTVLVQFADGDPAWPFVAAYETPGASGFTPQSLTLAAVQSLALECDSVSAAGGFARVLRDGDQINIPGVQAGSGVTGVIVTLTQPDGGPPGPPPLFTSGLKA